MTAQPYDREAIIDGLTHITAPFHQLIRDLEDAQADPWLIATIENARALAGIRIAALEEAITATIGADAKALVDPQTWCIRGFVINGKEEKP